MFPGTSVSLTSLAKGSDDGLDPINYAWYFQSNIMSGQTDATLSLASVVPANQGAYYVVATNSFGWATSVVVQLTVYQAPSFPVGLSNELVDAGSNLLLNPDASGTPPLAYSWKLDTTVLSNTTAFLALTNITPSQAGYYSVTVTNQFGSISTTGKISVFLPSSQVVAGAMILEGKPMCRPIWMTRWRWPVGTIIRSPSGMMEPWLLGIR